MMMRGLAAQRLNQPTKGSDQPPATFTTTNCLEMLVLFYHIYPDEQAVEYLLCSWTAVNG